MNVDTSTPGLVSEFELPGTVSELLLLTLSGLVNPCRESLAEADRDLSVALEAAERRYASAKSQADSSVRQHQKQLQFAESQVESAGADIRNICDGAAAQLDRRGSWAGDSASRLTAPAAPLGPGSAIDLDTPSLEQAIAPLRAEGDSLGRMSEPMYWPKGVGGRWIVVLASLVLLGTWYPLVIAWPLIVFVGRFVWRGQAKRGLDRLIDRSELVLTSLEASRALARQVSQREIQSASADITTATEVRELAVTDARAAFDSRLAGISASTATAIAELRTKSDRLWGATGYAGADWDSPAWASWDPDPSPEFAARLGTFDLVAPDLQSRFSSIDFSFRLPALVPFAKGKCLLFNTLPPGMPSAAAAMQSLIIRVLANTPPGKARFTFVDPIGLGQNVADFMRLGDYDGSLISGKVWTEPQHIENQLTELTEHMETVIQKYLRTDFASIQEYNAQAHEVAESFRFLVVFDFPVSFSEAAARRLVSIVRNGPRCGVYTFVIRDTLKSPPYGFDLADLEQGATIVSWKDAKSPEVSATWPAGNSPEVRLVPDALGGRPGLRLSKRYLAPAPLAATIIAKSGETAVVAMKVEVPFSKLFESMDGFRPWEQSASNSIRVPLGPTGARKLQLLALGEGLAHHGLIVGRTGSGKTNVMHVIIAGLAISYSPAELQLFLIDFKGGVGFKPYAEHGLPHAAVIAIESDREFGFSVLQGLDSELQRRFELFRAAKVDNLADYRHKKPTTAPALPRVLLVVDEFQELFSHDDAIAIQARTIFDRVVRQGRSFGLHILLGTQSLAGSAQLPPSTMGQMAVRIALPCSDADARLILAEDNVAARSLSRPGEAIYNAAAGLIEGNNPFQAAWLSDSDLLQHLQLVSSLAKERGVEFGGMVFEGSEPATLAECKPLAALVAAPSWAAPPKAPAVWLGEPVAVLPPVSGLLARQTGKHLLIITRDEAEGMASLYAAWVSLLSQHRPMTARFHVMDFCTADCLWSGYSSEIRSLFGHEIDSLNRRNTAETLGLLATTVRHRLEAPSQDDVPVFLLIAGLQRARDLREPEGYFPSANAEPIPATLLAELLRDGPEAGVHVLSWCDTVTNARRTLGMAFREFGMRLAGPMSPEESNLFLDSSDAARIDRPHRLIYSDEDQPGIVQKLRPYSLPSLDWLNSVAATQRSRPHE